MKKISSFILALSFVISVTTTAFGAWSYYNGTIAYTVVTSGSTIGVTLSASPTSMTLPTNTTTLTWTTSGSPDSCTATNAWSGSKSAAGGTEQINGLTAGNHLFEISCTKAGATNSPVTASALVVVSPEPTPSGTLGATSCTIAQGASTCGNTVSWTTANLTPAATAITRNTGTPASFTPSPLASGSQGATIGYSTTTFYLYHNAVLLAQASAIGTCASGSTWNGSICEQNSSQVSVTLAASPTTINQGASSVLTWGSTNATSCTGTGFNTGNAISGNTTVSPASTTTYTVSCSGAGGTAIAQATVTVNPACGEKCPLVTLIAVPTSITLGSSATLIWTSNAYVTSCTGTGFNTGGAPSGSTSVSPLVTTTYRVECTGPFGDVSDSATVTVVEKKRPIFREF